MFKIITFFCLIILQTNLLAQTQEKVENFTLEDIKDDSKFTLDENANTPYIVLLITSAYCPYSKSYKERILALAKKYDEKVVKFVLINPESQQDTPEMMKNIAKEFNLTYLLDKEQIVTTKLKASKTPEAFVLQQNLGFFFIRYHGAIDNSPQLAEDVSQKYLENVIDALLNKKVLDFVTQKPTGCMIKK